MEKWKATRIMLKENYQNRIKELPESIRQFAGLVIVTIIVITFFFILNVMFGEGDINVESRTVDVHITRLRQSINIEGAKPLIRTVRSAGYSLEN